MSGDRRWVETGGGGDKSGGDRRGWRQEVGGDRKHSGTGRLPVKLQVQ